MSGAPPRLAFISPVFLFPADTGGRIRTSNVLRGLKGGAFHVTLIGPAGHEQAAKWAPQLREVCDELVSWGPPSTRPRWMRAIDLFDRLPVNVAADRLPGALDTVRRTLSSQPFDVVVFDFVHAAVLMPARVESATVCFTHNVEAEIFGRHSQQAGNAVIRRMWTSQQVKMERFERDALRRFDAVVAVSQRDAQQLQKQCGLAEMPHTIPTGVDLDFFAWREPPPVDAEHPPTVVFTGSMDWDANIDGVRFFISEVWPRVLAELPQARFVVVGRNPPASLIELASRQRGVALTGFVDDVRPHVRAAHLFVIPLRVGGGTRIKAFEAMAMGCPVVSTSVGIEGLDVVAGEHYVGQDTAPELAAAILTILANPALRSAYSRRARECVEQRFGHRVAAKAFERICLRVVEQRRAAAPRPRATPPQVSC